MKKYRVKIEKVEGGAYQHIHNIMLDSEDIGKVIKMMREVFSAEIQQRQKHLMAYVNQRHLTGVKKILKDLDIDLIDYHSIGKDTTPEEFIENEIFFETRE